MEYKEGDCFLYNCDFKDTLDVSTWNDAQFVVHTSKIKCGVDHNVETFDVIWHLCSTGGQTISESGQMLMRSRNIRHGDNLFGDDYLHDKPLYIIKQVGSIHYSERIKYAQFAPYNIDKCLAVVKTRSKQRIQDEEYSVKNGFVDREKVFAFKDEGFGAHVRDSLMFANAILMQDRALSKIMPKDYLMKILESRNFKKIIFADVPILNSLAKKVGIETTSMDLNTIKSFSPTKLTFDEIAVISENEAERMQNKQKTINEKLQLEKFDLSNVCDRLDADFWVYVHKFPHFGLHVLHRNKYNTITEELNPQEYVWANTINDYLCDDDELKFQMERLVFISDLTRELGFCIFQRDELLEPDIDKLKLFLERNKAKEKRMFGSWANFGDLIYATMPNIMLLKHFKVTFKVNNKDKDGLPLFLKFLFVLGLEPEYKAGKRVRKRPSFSDVFKKCLLRVLVHRTRFIAMVQRDFTDYLLQLDYSDMPTTINDIKRLWNQLDELYKRDHPQRYYRSKNIKLNIQYYGRINQLFEVCRKRRKLL